MDSDTTILVVDDEEAIRTLLVAILHSGGYKVLLAQNGEEALALFEEHRDSISLMLLDVMMGGMDGLILCKMLRKQCTTPIIMLTALGDEESEKRGFEAGADDYVSKPIKPSALLARISRRLKALELIKPTETMSYHGININNKSHEVTLDGALLQLSPTEYSLICYLIQHPKEVISRQQLLDDVWGTDYVGTLRTVDVHMARLRVKLLAKASYIQAVRGFGYMFEATGAS